MIKKRLLKIVSLLGFLFSFLILSPLVASAQLTIVATSISCPESTIGGLLCNFQQLLNSVVPVLLTVGVVYFVWGVVKYMIADSEEAKTKGRDTIIYGIIGFVVIIGLWGMVTLVVRTFGFGGTDLYAPNLIPIQPEADTCTIGTNLQGLLRFGTCIINNSVIPFIFALAVVMFIWGGIKFFIINADEEAKREQGKQFMIWGIISITVMICIWGIVAIIGGTFGIGGTVLPQVCPPGSVNCP